MQHDGIKEPSRTDRSMGKNPSENEDKKPKSKPWYKFGVDSTALETELLKKE
uniref:Uncharacterized protein n=2 Tax=Babesia bovis TaxID=5865 RepID=A7ANJ0_BABBO|eukprot:XP_001611692.1 hypothetical protein [Babesia bovis T2Bo]